jgi:enoyl-CoA hydratase
LEPPVVIVERVGRVGRVALNRPHTLNAFSDAMMDALGGGWELALACDVVVAGRSASFGLREIKLGLLPGAGGTQRLPRAIGKAKAMDMCLSARMLDAEEADRYGLVSRVVDDDKLRGETDKLAATIASFSAPALMTLKQCVNRAFESSLTEGVLFERREL